MVPQITKILGGGDVVANSPGSGLEGRDHDRDSVGSLRSSFGDGRPSFGSSFTPSVMDGSVVTSSRAGLVGLGNDSNGDDAGTLRGPRGGEGEGASENSQKGKISLKSLAKGVLSAKKMTRFAMDGADRAGSTDLSGEGSEHEGNRGSVTFGVLPGAGGTEGGGGGGGSRRSGVSFGEGFGTGSMGTHTGWMGYDGHGSFIPTNNDFDPVSKPYTFASFLRSFANFTHSLTYY